MNAPVPRKKEPPISAKPAWQLAGPVAQPRPAGAAWKCLLAVAVALQAAWIVALVVMAMK
jgi:hypothetical protein